MINVDVEREQKRRQKEGQHIAYYTGKLDFASIFLRGGGERKSAQAVNHNERAFVYRTVSANRCACELENGVNGAEFPGTE